jgi:hypothetical protein
MKGYKGGQKECRRDETGEEEEEEERDARRRREPIPSPNLAGERKLLFY